MKKSALFLSIGIALSLGLAWVASGYASLQGWSSFLASLTLGAGILWGGWRIVRLEAAPRWLLALLIGSALLRLAVALFWALALPAWGYGNPAEEAGYVMADAYERDTAAWELAESDQPLLNAFRAYRAVDQYGGLIYFSAAVYRYLGGAVHQPLMMAMLAAAFSALSVIFTWGFVRRLWGEAAACAAAWIVALYPEAVLLGSSQMREAFTMTLAAAAFYGLAWVWRERDRRGGVLTLAALLLSVPLSPTFAMLLAGVLALLSLALTARGGWRIIALMGGLVLVAAGGLVFFSLQTGSGVAGSPLGALMHWVERTRVWQEILTRQASGWMAKVFASTPLALHGWLVLGYGVLQPFLPAALIASGSPLWKGIAIWRALGWMALLPLLLYASLRAARAPRARAALLGSLACWGVILASVLRAGGDQWDNPRYRVAFIALQAALAGWAWAQQRRAPDASLRRVLISAALVLAWFVPWYLRRYTPLDWAVVDVFKTLGLGFASAVLYWIWDWARLTGID